MSIARRSEPYTIIGPAEEIAFSDLGFRRIPIVAHSTRGTPFLRWIPIGMPRLPPKTLESVCYLYCDEEDAREGREFGGTAFLVYLPSRHQGRGYVYAITNWHVACRDGASVLRVNRHDGQSDIFACDPSEWVFDPGYDIAVRPLLLTPEHKFSVIHANLFMTEEQIAQHRIGVGDDLFMIGRFVDHDGGPVNRPAARFGNISVMPSPIEQPNGKMADSYCIDLHSRSGYSGSPVFVYRLPGADLERITPDPSKAAENPMEIFSRILFQGSHIWGLLGIHFAQFPEIWELKSGQYAEQETHSVPIIREGGYVKGLSGMTCVLPAWHILNILNLPALREHRALQEDMEEQRRRREGYPPEAEA